MSCSLSKCARSPTPLRPSSSLSQWLCYIASFP
ncbi:hypothetical protein IEO21_01842 [Rhodonia placenta]|uniref:Uncharacterized protein n=1 Tax=Rhodonia placenta TaxID=104341 RepID=A0A8H7P8N7_9APHY|nr:hypothetical protein IEO21_01842 [Postia placenta]